MAAPRTPAWTDTLTSCINDVVIMRPENPLETLGQLLADSNARPNWKESAAMYAKRHDIHNRLALALDQAGINPREAPPRGVLDLLSAALLGETAAAAGGKKAAAKAAEAAKVKEAVGALVAAANTRGAELRATAGAGSRPTVVVLTGGPGVGKTTLINHLHQMHGWPIVPEAAIQAIEMLNNQLGKDGQKAWRSEQVGAFGDMVGRVAMQQEEKAVAENAGGAGGVVLFDRTVLDNLGYSLQKGYPLPKYLTTEVAANAVSRIDHVLILDWVASDEEIEARNKATGRMTPTLTLTLTLSTGNCGSSSGHAAGDSNPMQC